MKIKLLSLILTLILLFSVMIVAQEEKELGSITLEGNKITNNLPKDLKIDINFEDNLFEGKKGFKSQATGRQVPEKPKLIESIKIVEKGGIKFLEINSQNENYKFNPIPIVEGLNIKISRQGLDGVRVKVDMPLIEKKNILAKDKSGIMLVIPEEKLNFMLNQFKENS